MPSVPRHLRVPLALTLLASIMLGDGCGGNPSQQQAPKRPPVVVDVVEVASVELPRTLAAVGALRSPDTAVVAAEVAGAIVMLEIPQGSRVDRGHVLARVDDAELQAAVDVAKARYRQASNHLERMRALHKKGVSSQQELDDAVMGFDAAEGELDELRTRLEKTAIRAPFDGIVGLRQVSLGNYVEVGMAIVKITRLDPLELVFGVPQQHAGDVAVGQAVLGVVGRCGQRFEGKVTAVDPVVDTATRSVQIQAQISNAEGRLAPGMSARLRLVVGRFADALTVPRESVVRQGTKHFVYVLDEENRARQQEVALGQFFVDCVQVTEGVQGGDRVVTAGHQKLWPGASTVPQAHAPTENPNLELGWYGPEADC